MNSVGVGNNSSELEIFIPENSPLKRVDKRNNLFLKFRKKFNSVEHKEKETGTKLQEIIKPTKNSKFSLTDIRFE